MKGLFIGMNTFDLELLTNKYPEENTKVKALEAGVYTGGPATNAAVIYARLGGEAILLTAIGLHPFANFIEVELAEYGVAIVDFKSGQKTKPVLSSIISNIETGSRNVFAFNPAEPYTNLNKIDFKLHDKISIILIDGFYPEIALKVIPFAKQFKIPVVLDGGSWKNGMGNLLKYTDFVVCSADFFPPGCKNTNDVFDFLHKAGIKQIAVTRGEKPVLFAENDKSGEIPVRKIKAADTLGAGDFFHGAFCYYLANGSNFVSALEKASELATESCKSFGTRDWIKSIKYR